jgi:hypothetical protein
LGEDPTTGASLERAAPTEQGDGAGRSLLDDEFHAPVSRAAGIRVVGGYRRRVGVAERPQARGGYAVLVRECRDDRLGAPLGQH